MLARPYGTHPLSVPSAEVPLHPHRTNHACRLCCSRALWTVKQRAPLVSASATRCSTVQFMAPVRVLLPNPNRQRKEQQQKNPPNQQQTQKEQTDQRQTKDTAEKRGGENPQKDRTDMAAPVKYTANSTRGQWTLAPEQQDRPQESPTLARGRATHTHSQKQVRAKRQGERRQSSGGRTKHRHRDTQHRGRRRRGQEKGRGMARKNQRGYSSALPNVPWGSWNIKDEYLSVAEQSNAKSFQSGVEGDETPHRARPLVPQ